MRTKLARLMTKASRQRQPHYPRKADKELRILDKTRPLQSAPEAAEWLVVMVAPRREEEACIALHEAGYHAWRPQTAVWLTSARLRVKSKVNRPLFPRYVFVSQRPGVTKPIGACDHVTYIVGTVPRPTIKRPSFIVDLSSRQQKGEFDATFTKPIPMFGFSQAVQIQDEGPFHGLNGIVEKSEGERVIILLSLFGGARRVEIDAERLAAL